MIMRGDTFLQTLLVQEHADRLAEAALWVARDLYPEVDVAAYLERLHFYAEIIGERLTPYVKLGDVLFHLNDYLFNDRGFYCDSSAPYVPESNLLHKVIDRRSGVPLSMTIIYLTVGRWLGLPLVSLSFPGRILVKYVDEDGEVVIDPAEGGIPLHETDLEMLLSRTYTMERETSWPLKHLLSTSDDKTVLLHMLRRLKQAYLLHGDLQRALCTLKNVLQLMPEFASAFRERGYLYELLDCRNAAAEDYSRYLELLPDAGDAEVLRRRLPKLLRAPVTFH